MTQTSNKILTLRQKQFVEEYITNGQNAAQACIKIGYSSNENTVYKTANRMLRNQLVLGEIKRRLLVSKEKMEVTFDYKVDKLKRIVERCTDEAIIQPDKMAKLSNTAISAISELNKMQGHYSAEKHLTVTVDTDIQYIKQVMAELLEKYKSEY